MLQKTIPIPSSKDEKGKYKVCPFCKTKFYYQDWLDEIIKKGHYNPKVLPMFWENKKYCTKECLYDYRTTMSKKCEHCEKKYFRKRSLSTSLWSKQRFCKRICSREHIMIAKVATMSGLPHKFLKQKLIEIATEYHGGAK